MANNFQISWSDEFRCEVYDVSEDYVITVRVLDLPPAFGDRLQVRMEGYLFPDALSPVKEEAREAKVVRQAMLNLLRRGPIYITNVVRAGGSTLIAKVFYAHGNLAEELEEADLARKSRPELVDQPWFTEGELMAIRNEV